MNQSILRAEKIKICRTSTGPVATHGAEFWTLSKGIVKAGGYF
jgi:hypothetical protein